MYIYNSTAIYIVTVTNVLEWLPPFNVDFLDMYCNPKKTNKIGLKLSHQIYHLRLQLLFCLSLISCSCIFMYCSCVLTIEDKYCFKFNENFAFRCCCEIILHSQHLLFINWLWQQNAFINIFFCNVFVCYFYLSYSR